MEKRYIRKDGAVILVRLSVSLARGQDGAPKHFIGQIQDLTDQRAIENRYRLMAENATDVIVISDLNGVATFVSPASEAVTGYKPEERMGHSPKPISHPDDTPALYASFKNLLKGGRRPGPLARPAQGGRLGLGGVQSRADARRGHRRADRLPGRASATSPPRKPRRTPWPRPVSTPRRPCAPRPTSWPI
jgi:PAS domain-containing protein